MAAPCARRRNAVHCVCFIGSAAKASDNETGWGLLFLTLVLLALLVVVVPMRRRLKLVEPGVEVPHRLAHLAQLRESLLQHGDLPVPRRRPRERFRQLRLDDREPLGLWHRRG